MVVLLVEERNSQITNEGTVPITVNKDVVRHLSLGLYRNFALAVKELVSNSYDAGATEIKIKLDLKNNKIILRDNGRGMDLNEFEKKYLKIGFLKEPSKKPDELGRMRIGVFGIGFLATLPYCKTMKVITKKRGNDKAIEGTVDAENFFRKGTWDIQGERVPFIEYKSDIPKKEGETIIVLEDIKPQIADELKRSKSTGMSNLDQFGGFEKFKWTLCQYAPIQFPPQYKNLTNFFNQRDRVPLRLWLDGEELFRNVPDGVRILEKNSKDFGDISLKYVIMSPINVIKPEEARGLQVRLKDVAVGFPRDFDVTKLYGRVLGKLNYICGEVHILKGLDNALMVNRDSFNYTEEVAEIYRFFQGKLREWNDKLYNWADKDKNLYEALGKLRENEEIVEGLKRIDAVHFDKERLRLQRVPIVKARKTKLDKPSKKMVKILSETKKKDYAVIQKSGVISAAEVPIKVSQKDKTITIYENHPAFKEEIKMDGKKFNVSYDEWDPSKTSFSICKIHDKNNEVIFNAEHPLFKSKLSDEIVKRLSLGIVFISKGRKDREELIKKLNYLLEDVFLNR